MRALIAILLTVGFMCYGWSPHGDDVKGNVVRANLEPTESVANSKDERTCRPIKLIYSATFTMKDDDNGTTELVQPYTKFLNEKMLQKGDLGFVINQKYPYVPVVPDFVTRRVFNFKLVKRNKLITDEIRADTKKMKVEYPAWADAAPIVREAKTGDPYAFPVGNAKYYLRVVCKYGQPDSEVLFQGPLETDAQFEAAKTALIKKHLLQP